MEHLLENDLIITLQHGFQSGRSCVTQLLECFHQWADDLNMGKGTDTIYLDFSKAFDSVSHSHLLYKLHHYSIRGKLLLWLKSFLTNRRQRVVQQQHMSAWSHVVSGVPQGTISGPVLFLIILNDIPECCNTYVKVFADDTKLFNNNTNRTECHYIQYDLNALSAWSKTWHMNFNASKCTVLRIKLKTSFTYSLNTTPLKEEN